MNETVKRERTVNITFRKNRSFEFKSGRTVYRFEGRETQPVPKSVLADPEFQRISHYFVVEE